VVTVSSILLVTCDNVLWTLECSNDGSNLDIAYDIYFSVYQAQSLPYNYKVDIYSLGVILFELLVPFGTNMERSCTLMDVRNNKFPAHFQQQFQQEVRSCTSWWGGVGTYIC
jgi:translation initiation factor 2-alpha kinase 3